MHADRAISSRLEDHPCIADWDAQVYTTIGIVRSVLRQAACTETTGAAIVESTAIFNAEGFHEMKENQQFLQ